MDIDRYNTRVRQAISDRYVASSKQIQKCERQIIELRAKLKRFMDGTENMTYQEYIDTKDAIEYKTIECQTLSIHRGVWDEARELCLNIADEMDGD